MICTGKEKKDTQLSREKIWMEGVASAQGLRQQDTVGFTGGEIFEVGLREQVGGPWRRTSSHNQSTQVLAKGKQ